MGIQALVTAGVIHIMDGIHGIIMVGHMVDFMGPIGVLLIIIMDITILFMVIRTTTILIITMATILIIREGMHIIQEDAVMQTR